VAEDGACQDDWECLTGYCRGDVKPPYRKDGVCAVQLAPGAECLEDDECLSGSCSFTENLCEENGSRSDTRLCGNRP
jgi:hypothetical protein